MDIEYLKRFVVIGETLNFRKASETLFISQPALSHSIAALEKEIGTPVFVRNTKNVAFTPEGEILFDATKEILEKYENALAAINKITTANDNLLKVGYVGAALDNSLTPLLRTFRKAEPSINVNLTRYHGTEIRQLVESQTIHFAVAYSEYTDAIPGINQEILDREKFSLLVNSSDPLADKAEATMEEIASLPLIICEKENAPYYYNTVMKIFEEASVTPNIVQKVRLVSDIYRLVDMGVGCAILSYSPNKQIFNAFDLSFVPIKHNKPELLEHNKTLSWCGNLSPAGKKFLKTVKQFYKDI